MAHSLHALASHPPATESAQHSTPGAPHSIQRPNTLHPRQDGPCLSVIVGVKVPGTVSRRNSSSQDLSFLFWNMGSEGAKVASGLMGMADWCPPGTGQLCRCCPHTHSPQGLPGSECVPGCSREGQGGHTQSDLTPSWEGALSGNCQQTTVQECGLCGAEEVAWVGRPLWLSVAARPGLGRATGLSESCGHNLRPGAWFCFNRAEAEKEPCCPG